MADAWLKMRVVLDISVYFVPTDCLGLVARRTSIGIEKY